MINSVFVIVFVIHIVLAQKCKLLNECYEKQGRGTCASDSTTCICNVGFDGESCNVLPWRLQKGTIVPGFVANGAYSYFRVDVEDYAVNDEAVPTVNEQGQFRFQYQAIANPDNADQYIISISSLASRQPYVDDLNFYVTVHASAANGIGVRFELFHWDGAIDYGLMRGLEDWAAIAVLMCLGALALTGCVLGAFCWVAAGGELRSSEQTALQAAERERVRREKEEREEQRRATAAASMYDPDAYLQSAPSGAYNNGTGGSYNGGGGGPAAGGYHNGGSVGYNGGGSVFNNDYDAQW